MAAIIVAAMCAAIGVFLTLRKESFLAEAIAHGSLAGIAFAFLISAEPFFIALVTAIAMSVAITYVRRRTQVSSDSVIGIIFPMLFAAGIVMLSSSNSYRPELQSYLFGSLLSVSWLDIVYASVALVIVGITIMSLYSQLIYSTFDPEAAHIRGIRVAAIDYIIAIIASVTIIVAVKLVGIILVTAFLVIPATSAKLLARKFSHMIPIALAHNILAAIIGIAISPNAPPGATIVLVSGSLFLLVLVVTKLRR
jgi:zinc transport system permease protein